MPRAICVSLTLLISAPAGWAQDETRSDEALPERVTVLFSTANAATLPGTDRESVHVSSFHTPGLEALGFVEETSSGKHQVHINGTPRGTFDRVEAITIDGPRHYTALVQEDGRSWIVVNGRKRFQVEGANLSRAWKLLVTCTLRGKPVSILGKHVIQDAKIQETIFAKRSAAILTLGKGQCMWIDGERGPTFRRVRQMLGGDEYENFVFDVGEERVAYRVQDAKLKWSVVLDGKQGPSYRAIGAAAFSRGGERLAYGARKGVRDAVLVIDGIEHPAQGRRIVRVLWSPDGSHLAYVARGKFGRHSFALVHDGEVLAAFDEFRSLSFGKDQKPLTYSFLRGTELYAVMNGKEIACGQPGEFTSHHLDVHEHSGRTVTKGFATSGKQRFVIDGKPGPGSPM